MSRRITEYWYREPAISSGGDYLVVPGGCPMCSNTQIAEDTGNAATLAFHGPRDMQEHSLSAAVVRMGKVEEDNDW